MIYKIIPFPDLHYELKGKQENNKRAVSHNHKPSITLAMAR